MAELLHEKDLSEIWRQMRFSRALLTEAGERVEVIYPGRSNDSRGADFRDAVIALSGRPMAGDVELHVKSEDWRVHGHDRDPNYNKVMLHVVYSGAGTCSTALEDGRSVPVLALDRYVGNHARGNAAATGSGRPCAGALRRLGAEAVFAVLERSGDDRLSGKRRAFFAELRTAGPGQVLYQGIMMALGYSRNKAPFLELSHRLPLAALEAIARQAHVVEAARQELEDCLLEAAGLQLPQAVSHLPSVERPPSSASLAPVLGWDTFRSRPGNCPRARLKAMSYLLVRHRRRGLLDGLLAVIRDAPGQRGHRSVEDALLIGPSDGPGACAGLLGRDRAAEIAVNVLLPFAGAVGELRRERDLVCKVDLLYRAWPRLGANCLERHVASQIGLTPRQVGSARRQQGLIGLYANLCTRGRCATCPLGQP